MSSTAPASSTTSDSGATASMEAAFNEAIAESAKITTITTEKKVELDAAQQRPSQG